VDDQLLTVAEVAARTRVTEETIRRWLRQRLLRGVCLSRKGGWRVRRSDLEAFLADRANLPPALVAGNAASTGHDGNTRGGGAMTLKEALNRSPSGVAVAELGDAFRSRCRVSRSDHDTVELSMAASGPFSTLHDVARFSDLDELLDARPYLTSLDWQPA
jgi:excisionase family DNA binding protein